MSGLLNITVDSRQGEAEVLAFKKFVQENLSSIKFDVKVANLPTLKMQIDEAALNAGIKSVLNEVHELSINTGSLIKTVQEALRQAFSTEFQVRIASTHLTEQVAAAVKAGMVGEIGGVIPRTNTGSITGASFTPAMLAEAVRTAVLPLADKIDSMTKQTEGSLRAGRRTGTISSSASVDGASVSVKTSVAPDEALKLVQEGQALKAKEKEDREIERENARSLAELQRQDAEQRAYEIRAFREEKAYELAAQKERDAAWAQIEKAAEAERRSMYTAAFEQEEAMREAHADRLLAIDKAQRAAEVAQAKEAQTIALAQIREHEAELDEMARARVASDKAANDAQVLALREGLNEQKAEQKTVLAQLEAEQEAYEQKIKDSYKRLKLAASEQYKGVGPSIAAGSQIQQSHGTAAAQLALGSDSYLLGEIANLEKYRKVVDDLAPSVDKAMLAHAGMTKVMGEAHSAARGLTGALGALWLTWGSLVPMVAGAAIGTALQQTFSVGKDLEYQLTFVSALSAGAIVDLDKFGDAVRGNLIVPKEAAEGMRALAQNGLNVTDSLKALPDVLRLATVGEMSVSDAALGATGVMNAFGLSVDDLGRIADVFAKAAAESNTSVQGMVESMKQASTVSDLFHVSLEETAATLEIMAKRNITGTQAGTAFRKMVEEIATPGTQAKKTIELLGLQFYDSATHQLKPFSEILQEIKTRTDKLNEQSKLELLNNIFGERGAKALNAVLSDFDQYSSALKTLKEESQDFAKGVADQLSQTTEGRLKAAMTDFQLVAAQSFDSAGGSASRFIDTFRELVDDPKFKQGLTGLANNVAALSQFFLENGKDLVELGVTWASFNTIEGLVYQGMLAVTGATAAKAAADVEATATAGVAAAAMESEAVAATGASVAYKGLSVSMGLATFGLSAVMAIVVPLIAEWLIFKDHTDELTNSIDNNAAAIKRQHETLEQEATRLQTTNAILAERNRLMAEGMSYADAEKQANANAETNSASRKREELVGNYRSAQAKAAEDQRNADLSLTAEDGGFAAQRAADKSKAEADKAYKAWQDFEANLEVAQKNAGVTANNVAQQGMLALRKQVEEFNNQVEDLSKTNPKIAALKAHVTIGKDESQEDIAKDLKAQQDAVNKAKEDLHLPDKNKRSEELAETAGLIAEIKRREKELQDYYTFRAQLEQKLFQDGMNNARVKADADAAIEQEQLDAIKEQVKLDTERLRAEERKYPGKEGEAERTKIENEIKALQDQARQLQTVIDRKRVLAELDAQAAEQKDNAKFDKTLSGLAAADRKRLGDEQNKFDATIKSPPGAYQQGYHATMDAYSAPIADQTAELKKQQDILNEMNDRMEAIKGTGDSQTDQYQKQIEDQQKLVQLEQDRLDKMNDQAVAAAQKTGTLTQQLYDRAQTAGYGWDKFWSNFSQNATSNAKIVGDVMSTTFNGMSQEFANFVTTGKFNFKSLCATILAEAAKMLANKAIVELLQLGANLFGGGYTSGGSAASNAPDNIDAGGGWSPADLGGGDAGGGQVGANELHPVNENDPELYTYNGKQYLMAGSKGGKVTPMDRAYQGSPTAQSWAASGGGANMQQNNSVNMNINIASDGQTKVSQDKSGQSAGELGRMLNNAVLDVLTEQQRPGGRLYALKGN